MNHGSNDAGRVHEEVVSPVLPVFMNLTGPDALVVLPWGGKNTVGVGSQCVWGTSNQHVMCVRDYHRTKKSCSWKQISGPLFLSFLWINKHCSAAVYTCSVVSRLSSANVSTFVVWLIKVRQIASCYREAPQLERIQAGKLVRTLKYDEMSDNMSEESNKSDTIVYSQRGHGAH